MKGRSAAIGGGLRKDVNNLIINGGNIETVYSNGTGIGTYSDKMGQGNLKNLQINGGNITAYGGEYGAAIGGDIDAEIGEITITGGNLNLINNGYTKFMQNVALGFGCTSIDISGGTINCNTGYNIGVGTVDVTEKINITGGNLLVNSAVLDFAVLPTSSENNVYLTEIWLQNVTQEVQVTSFETSDNLTYGIKDMYTTSEGKLYVYLPTGERTITIKAGEKEYTGTVVTGDADATESVTLVEK